MWHDGAHPPILKNDTLRESIAIATRCLLQCLHQTPQWRNYYAPVSLDRNPSPACKSGFRECLALPLLRWCHPCNCHAPRAPIRRRSGRGRKTRCQIAVWQKYRKGRDDRKARLGLVPTHSCPPTGTTSLRLRPPTATPVQAPPPLQAWIRLLHATD